MKQKQVNDLQQSIQQIYQEISTERKNQRQTLKDLRTFLTTTQGEDGMEQVVDHAGVEQQYYQQDQQQVHLNNQLSEYYDTNNHDDSQEWKWWSKYMFLFMICF